MCADDLEQRPTGLTGCVVMSGSRTGYIFLKCSAARGAVPHVHVQEHHQKGTASCAAKCMSTYICPCTLKRTRGPDHAQLGINNVGRHAAHNLHMHSPIQMPSSKSKCVPNVTVGFGALRGGRCPNKKIHDLNSHEF